MGGLDKFFQSTHSFAPLTFQSNSVLQIATRSTPRMRSSDELPTVTAYDDIPCGLLAVGSCATVKDWRAFFLFILRGFTFGGPPVGSDGLARRARRPSFAADLSTFDRRPPAIRSSGPPPEEPGPDLLVALEASLARTVDSDRDRGVAGRVGASMFVPRLFALRKAFSSRLIL